jgi:hypothetical protein
METRRHEPRGMGDVGHERGVHLIGDLAKGLEVDGARKRRAARDHQLGSVLLREVSHLVEIDALRILSDAVGTIL